MPIAVLFCCELHDVTAICKKVGDYKSKANVGEPSFFTRYPPASLAPQAAMPLPPRCQR